MGIDHKKHTLTRGHVLRLLLFLYDVFAVNFAYFISVWLRFSDADSFRSQGIKYMSMFKHFAPWYTLTCIVLFVVFRLYSSVWRYVGVNDVKRLVLVNICTCTLYICGSLFIVGRMPVSVYGLGAGIQFVLMCASRFAPRYIMDSISSAKSVEGSSVSIPMMIVGIGENAKIIQNKIARDRTNIVKPVCVVDYDYGFKGNSFNGLPVFSGPDAPLKCIEKYDIKCVIIADGNLPNEFLDSIRDLCGSRDIELRDFVIGTEYRTRGVGIRELLGMVDGPIRIEYSSGEDHLFDNGKEALRSIRDNCTVDSITVNEGAVNIRLNINDLATGNANEEWIAKYREEMGSDVSFF